MRSLTILLLAAVAAPCASASASIGWEPTDVRWDPSTQALVVGSITYERGGSRYSITGTASDGEHGFLASYAGGTIAPPGPEFGEASKIRGGTFVVPVAPGQYTLQRWNVLHGVTTSQSRALGIAFTAGTGQVTYLGEFHFDAEGNVTLADQATRDLEVLRKGFPAIGTAAPAHAIRVGTRIANLGGDATPPVDPTIYRDEAGAASAAAATATPGFDPQAMASIQDSAVETGEGPGGQRFFVVRRINGKDVAKDAESASMRASRGKGNFMELVDVERPAPAGRTRLSLQGSIEHAAPIVAIFAAIASGGSREVSGDVDVDLKPGARYRVNGAIDDLRSAIWLEDADSRQVVPGSTVEVQTPEGRNAAAAPAMFTCCNLHIDDERWISDANWLDKPFLPAGTPVRVYELKSDRAKAMIDGRVAWLGLDYGRKQQTEAQLVAKLAVADDPRERIRTWPPGIQAAVRAGKVLPGMTREQVVVAIGYPRMDLTPDMEAPRWSYVDASDVKFALLWGVDGRLQAVEAPPAVQALLVCSPECVAGR
jgi:hypothetical protein